MGVAIRLGKVVHRDFLHFSVLDRGLHNNLDSLPSKHVVGISLGKGPYYDSQKMITTRIYRT